MILAYKSSLKDSIFMVWCGIFFLPGNWVFKAQFIYQQNLKKFKVSSLSCTSQNTQKKFKKSRNTTIRLEGERILRSDRRGDLGRSGTWVVWVARDLGRSNTTWVFLFIYFMASLICSGFFSCQMWFLSDAFKGYKLSLRDSISIWSPRGKICHIGRD